MNYSKESLKLHSKHTGKLKVASKLRPLSSKDDLSVVYTPGVAEPCRAIAQNPEDVYTYTPKGNMVAVVSDGSSVLGLGNIGAHAAIPVMEGKAILFKEFGGIDAFPICVTSQDTQTIIKTVKEIAPVFGGINLEDIAAPKCFEIEAALQDLGIPVMHDDQHGTAVVVLAGMINALKVAKKDLSSIKVVTSGAGAAGVAVTKLLISAGLESKNVIMCDSKGIIFEGRDNLNDIKQSLAEITNEDKTTGSLADALKDADVFIGVSIANTVTEEMVQSMAKDPIIFAMANPDPEIVPDLAANAGAAIVATGRSDFPNQVNNVLGFPGIFRGALDCRATRITEEMKLAAAHALAGLVDSPTKDNILPYALDKSVVPTISTAVQNAWKTKKASDDA